MKMATATKGKRPLRHLSACDKIMAIQRIHDGESKASVARDIGVPESTLRGWCKNEDKLRCMSRQSLENADKLQDPNMSSMSDLFNGPDSKRMKLDASIFGNGKLKYDDYAHFKNGRSSMGGLDLSGSDKRLSLDHNDMNLSGFQPPDFSAFAKSSAELNKQLNKVKGYGNDHNKQSDPSKSDLSMQAISPLTSLSHLSGMGGLGQALSFNDIASNLNLLAQLNPSLAAMSGLTGLSGLNGSPQSSQSQRGPRVKTSTSPLPSPRSSSGADGADKPSLTVKNLAKLQQKTSSSDIMRGAMLDKYKKAQAMAQPDLGAGDDALWYWLKSQQAMMGLNSLYQSQLPPRSSSPKTSSPHQSSAQHPSQGASQTPTPEISSPHPPATATTPPLGTPDDSKNQQASSAWFWQWYKTFGASMMGDKNKMGGPGGSKEAYDNILYSQLMKGTSSGAMSNGAINNNTINNNFNIPAPEGDHETKPEDLSNHHQGVNGFHDEEDSINNISPIPTDDQKMTDDDEAVDHHQRQMDKAKTKLDDALSQQSPDNGEKSGDDASSVHENNDSNNNNKNADEEIKSPTEALEYGEKFLKYLESYSDPSLTAMQVMQFRYLLNSIKASVERAQNNISGSSSGASSADGEKSRHRKRK